jgi:hypothetical protein
VIIRIITKIARNHYIDNNVIYINCDIYPNFKKKSNNIYSVDDEVYYKEGKYKITSITNNAYYLSSDKLQGIDIKKRVPISNISNISKTIMKKEHLPTKKTLVSTITQPRYLYPFKKGDYVKEKNSKNNKLYIVKSYERSLTGTPTLQLINNNNQTESEVIAANYILAKTQNINDLQEGTIVKVEGRNDEDLDMIVSIHKKGILTTTKIQYKLLDGKLYDINHIY